MSNTEQQLFARDFNARLKKFPSDYIAQFNRIWKWKIRIENDESHILDKSHRAETYQKLLKILPKEQTYRKRGKSKPLQTLQRALTNISDAYNCLRNYTLLDFDAIPRDTLELIWHELGRVKEIQGRSNEYGYYIMAVCKPLLLLWGQTLAFDSRVRKNCPRSFQLRRYSTRWNLNDWIAVMSLFSRYLKNNVGYVETIRNESEKRYGRTHVVPYGRFLDMYYWVG